MQRHMGSLQTGSHLKGNSDLGTQRKMVRTYDQAMSSVVRLIEGDWWGLHANV